MFVCIILQPLDRRTSRSAIVPEERPRMLHDLLQLHALEQRHLCLAREGPDLQQLELEDLVQAQIRIRKHELAGHLKRRFIFEIS